MALTLEQKNRLELAFVLSEVSQAERDTWLARFEQAPEDLINSIIALFELYPEEIGWLGAIQQKKERALIKGNRAAWHKMVEEEKEHLAKLAAVYA